MKNKKKIESITETVAGLWIGTCTASWLCCAVEGNDTLAILFLVAALAGTAVCFGMYGLIDAKWRKAQKKQADRAVMFDDWMKNTMLKEKM